MRQATENRMGGKRKCGGNSEVVPKEFDTGPDGLQLSLTLALGGVRVSIACSGRSADTSCKIFKQLSDAMHCSAVPSVRPAVGDSTTTVAWGDR